MVKKRRAAAVTLDELGGAASKRVGFIRTDAKAIVAPTSSKSKLKASLVSPFEPKWPRASAEQAAQLLQQVAGSAALESSRAAGVIIGLNAVGRALRRGEVSAVILGQDLPQPLVVASLAAQAQQRRVPVCMLPFDSARLGQPFGLLRATAIGFASHVFDDAHATVQLIGHVSGVGAGPLPWLVEPPPRSCAAAPAGSEAAPATSEPAHGSSAATCER